jgi:Tol biopolymer transport system component
VTIATVVGIAVSASSAPAPSEGVSRFPIKRPADPREHHLANLRQLTDGVQNAEAYFSFDGTRLIFQSTRPPYECDQIFTMDLEGHDVRLLSTGLGRCTCSYFFPDGKRYLYASTHLGGPACPPPPDMSHGYVWALYPSFDIFVAALDDPTPHRLTDTPGYDAEATISPRGDRMVFTSVRNGDIDLYTMKLDGSDVRTAAKSSGAPRAPSPVRSWTSTSNSSPRG